MKESNYLYMVDMNTTYKSYIDCISWYIPLVQLYAGRYSNTMGSAFYLSIL